MTKTMKASEFKAKCLSVMDEVMASHERVVVTKNGVPVVDVVPHAAGKKTDLFGMWEGKIKIVGDIISPLDVEWEAMK